MLPTFGSMTGENRSEKHPTGFLAHAATNQPKVLRGDDGMTKIQEWTASAFPHVGQRLRTRGNMSIRGRVQTRKPDCRPPNNLGNSPTTTHETAVFSGLFRRSPFPDHRPAADARFAPKINNQPGGSSGLPTCRKLAANPRCTRRPAFYSGFRFTLKTAK